MESVATESKLPKTKAKKETSKARTEKKVSKTEVKKETATPQAAKVPEKRKHPHSVTELEAGGEKRNESGPSSAASKRPKRERGKGGPTPTETEEGRAKNIFHAYRRVTKK